MKISAPNIIRLLFGFVIGGVVAGISSDGLLADADEDLVARLKGWEVSVSPASFRYDDEITVIISGLPRDFPFDTNSVTLGGVKLHVPNPGDGPRGRVFSDNSRKFVFKTSIPDGLSPGGHYLRVDIRGNFVAKTLVELQPVTLRVSSLEVVPYQEVWVVATGFTKTRHKGKKKSKTINAMNLKSGSSSGVTIGGDMVHEPHIEYPVKLGKDGSVFFRMIVPQLDSTITPGLVELRVRDSEGREGVVALTVPNAKLKLDNSVSYPGENVPFSITGLPVPREDINDYVEVVYGYAIDKSGTKHAPMRIGSFIVDQTGGISGRFDIPDHALLSSSNRIWVTTSYGRSWEFNHYLGGRFINVNPASGLPGDPVKITIKGMPRNYPLTVGSVSIGGYRVEVPGHLGEIGPRPLSNDVGFVTFMSHVPTDVSPGYRYLTWNPPGGGTVSAGFDVIQSKLYFDPAWAVPGQAVTMTSGPNSVEVQGVEIAGSGASYVYIDAVEKFQDVIDYPIKVSSDGRLKTTFNVPISRSLDSQNSLEITTQDTAGRVARGTLHLARKSVTVTPSKSVRGSLVTVEGTGFFANTKESDTLYQVNVSYRGSLVRTAILDDTGTFKTSFNVPHDAVVGALNAITVEMENWPSIRLNAEHRVPAAAVHVTPGLASPGEYLVLIGTGFAPYRQVTIFVGHLWASNSGPCDVRCDLTAGEVHTNMSGEFKMFLEVPKNLENGLTDLKVYAHYPAQVASVPLTVR